MGIYLPNMEMPNLGYREIRIYPDGRVMEEDECGIDEVVGTAVPVPPHGDLIDKQYAYQNTMAMGEHMRKIILKQIDLLPTIIPAELAE